MKLLEYFSTTIGFGEGYNTLLSQLASKRYYNIPDAVIKRLWIPEIKRLLIKSDQEGNRRLADQAYSKLDTKTSKELSTHPAKFVHAYEDGACKTFRKAKELGIRCSYELPIAHWATSRKLLAEEAERYPQWEPTLESTRETEEKLFQKDEELWLADRISCPSQFVLDSIPTEIRNRIPSQVAPFGSPLNRQINSFTKRAHNEPFKIIFVGSMSQRKGLADLFEAMKLLKNEHVKLSVLGQPSMSKEFYRKHFANFEYYPACTNTKVREIMRRHDALVLPSIVEGRALVQQEALSCGLPIIVSRNAGAEDSIEEGVTGHLIPIRSPEKIAEMVLSLQNNGRNRSDIAESCVKKSRAYCWSSYAQKIIDFNLIGSD